MSDKRDGDHPRSESSSVDKQFDMPTDWVSGKDRDRAVGAGELSSGEWLVEFVDDANVDPDAMK